MSDYLRIGQPNPARPASRAEAGAASRPAAAPARPTAGAPSAPLDALALSSTGHASRLDVFSAPARGADVLPSLARIQAILSAAPAASPVVAPMRGRPELRAISDPAAFVQAAYEQALGRKPTRDELRPELARLEAGGDRQVLLERLASSGEFVRRAAGSDVAPQVGVPVSLRFGDRALSVRWPYPTGSRYGGPEALASVPGAEGFRAHMAPLANYFGAGTRGSLMQALAEQSAKGEVYPGSEATRQLGEIAQTLFWDVPMQQNSDAAMRQRGVGSDLNQPEQMVAYLQGQKQRLDLLKAQQNDAYDGPYQRAAAQELSAVVDAALARAEGYLAGDRSPVSATATGPYGLYDAAKPAQGAVPLASDAAIAANPKAAEADAIAKLVARAATLPDHSFYKRLGTYLVGY